jgi:hypothetical protein
LLLFVRRVLLMLAAALLPAVAAAQNGTITGTITNAANSAAVQGVTVNACMVTEVGGVNCPTVGFSNVSGVYNMSLPAGTYYLFTSNTGNLVDEIHNNIQCPGVCNSAAATSLGTATIVTAGGMVTRDFQLSPGGSISGTVNNAATAVLLPNITVQIFTRYFNQNLFVGSAMTNASGAYTVNGLGTGVYFALTANTSGFTNEIYDNILCVYSCSSATAIASGTEIAVSIGVDTPGRNFRLDTGGTVTGTVTNANTSLPVQNVFVGIYTRIGATVTFLTTSSATTASGAFTVTGLPTGTYFAVVLNPGQNYIGEIYGSIPCTLGCTSSTIGTGTPIAVTLGATTPDVNFQLDVGGMITGTITNAATALGLQNVGVSVCVQLATGSSCTSGMDIPTNAAGQYSIIGLQSGTYFIYTQNSQGFVDEIFDDIPCAGPCQNINAVAGAAVVVTAGATTAGRNFALAAGGTIAGTLTNEATAAPLSGYTVQVYRSVGATAVFVDSRNTSVAGGFNVGNLPTGTYFVFTSGTAQRLVNEIYNNIPCPGNSCSAFTAVSSGAPVAVNAGVLTPGIDFALAARTDPPSAPGNFGAVITGFSVQFSWTAPTAGAAATSYVIDAGGAPGTTAISLPVNGLSHTVPGVPPGTYYARVRGINAFGSGPPSAEFKIIVNPDGTGGLNPPTNLVVFMSGGRLTMTWTAPVFGGVPAGYVLEAGSATGLANIARVPLNTRSFTFDPVPPGFFFLRVRSRNGSNVSMPSVEMMINVGGVPAPPSAPQSFSHSVAGSTVTFTWVAPLFGTPTGYILEAGSESGLANIVSGAPIPNVLTISFSGVPPGTYYVRIRAVNAQGASVVSNERTVTVS